MEVVHLMMPSSALLAGSNSFNRSFWAFEPYFSRLIRTLFLTRLLRYSACPHSQAVSVSHIKLTAMTAGLRSITLGDLQNLFSLYIAKCIFNVRTSIQSCKTLLTNTPGLTSQRRHMVAHTWDPSIQKAEAGNCTLRPTWVKEPCPVLKQNKTKESKAKQSKANSRTAVAQGKAFA